MGTADAWEPAGLMLEKFRRHLPSSLVGVRGIHIDAGYSTTDRAEHSVHSGQLVGQGGQ
jgi:hypothetical protein